MVRCINVYFLCHPPLLSKKFYGSLNIHIYGKYNKTWLSRQIFWLYYGHSLLFHSNWNVCFRSYVAPLKQADDFCKVTDILPLFSTRNTSTILQITYRQLKLYMTCFGAFWSGLYDTSSIMFCSLTLLNHYPAPINCRTAPPCASLLFKESL